MRREGAHTQSQNQVKCWLWLVGGGERNGWENRRGRWDDRGFYGRDEGGRKGGRENVCVREGGREREGAGGRGKMKRG